MWRSLKHTFRLVHIAYVLARNDALYILEHLKLFPTALPTLLRLFARDDRAPTGKPLPKGHKLANALIALGPGFIKLGQALSTRADLVGDDVAAELAMLRDRLPPFPSRFAIQTVEEELGGPLTQFFAAFEHEPVAAASIAQVHFAVTTDGRPVAVKVLRPNIEERFRRDIDLLYWMAELVEERAPNLRRLKPLEIVRNFEDWVANETDFRMEAAAGSAFAERHRDDPEFRVPAIDWSRTSQRVITIERVHGIPIGDKEALERAGYDPREIARRAAVAFYRQVFRDGFFHGDLHPGNLFVEEGGRIVAVDFGIMGRLTLEDRAFLAQVFDAFLREDYDRVADIHIETGIVPRAEDRNAFALACRAIARPILGKPLYEISVARLLGHLFSVSNRFDMQLQPQFLLLQKNMMLAEGIGRILNPEVNMWEVVKPLVEDWARENLGPRKRIKSVLQQKSRLIRRLPMLIEDMEELIHKLKTEGLTVSPEVLHALTRRRNSKSLACLNLALWILILGFVGWLLTQ